MGELISSVNRELDVEVQNLWHYDVQLVELT
jgi:hypothetical protein